MTATVKGYKGISMEGPIASWYAKNTARDVQRFQKAAQTVMAQCPVGAKVLEVAPGPGYLAIELAKSGRRMTAIDVSKSFVHMLRENAAKAGVRIDCELGNASAMPFAEGSFDFVVCMAAFKNFSDPVGALNEIYRVLKPGGKASILDLSKDASMSDIDEQIAGMNLSTLSAWLTRFTFRYLLLKRAYRRSDLERMTGASRFGKCEIAAEGIGFEWKFRKDGGVQGEMA